MTPYCQSPSIDEDEICERNFESLDAITTAFFGGDSVPLAVSRHEEIQRSCRELVASQQRLTSAGRRGRRHRLSRVSAKSHLQVKFGLAGIMLLYYVVSILWMWRSLRK